MSQARGTWSLIRKGRLAGYGLKEESVTDFNLLELVRSAGSHIRVFPFTRAREGANGADWEWWLTGSSGSWLGYRVQAKIIDASGSEYRHLHYLPKSKVSQTDTLISRALSEPVPLIPLYCLYSNWDVAAHSAPWHCRRVSRSQMLLGCAVISPFRVRSLRAGNQRSLAAVSPFMRPWHCLVCCGGAAASGAEDLPLRSGRYWASTIGAEDAEILPENDEQIPDDLIETYRELGTPVVEPPGYVEAARAGKLDALADRNIAGIVVLDARDEGNLGGQT